jgi:hypothetical protein
VKLFSEFLTESIEQKLFIRSGIRYSKNMSKEKQLAAVKRDNWAIEYIVKAGINPSLEVRQEALKGDNLFPFISIAKAGLPISDAEMIAVIENNYNAFIQFLNYLVPSEAVQCAAYSLNGVLIEYFVAKLPNEPVTNKALNIALTHPRFIANNIDPDLIFKPDYDNFVQTSYDGFVKYYFRNNIILMNKWLRYADNVRNMG